MSGNISGRQSIEYAGGQAYNIADGERVTSENYQARLIAAVRGRNTRRSIRYFSVRTKTTVNMSAAMRENLAVMGGAGALFAGLVNDKSAAIYSDCVSVCPRDSSLRAFIMPKLIAGLTAKDEYITIAGNIAIINPWISSDIPNVPVTTAILDKFRSVLSN